MSNSTDSLIITTLFESPEGDDISNRYYRDVVLRTLKKILPADFFESKENRKTSRKVVSKRHILSQLQN